MGEGNGHPLQCPVFLPGEFQGWGSLVGCHLWGRTESDTTEATQQQQQQESTLPEFTLSVTLSVTLSFLEKLCIKGAISPPKRVYA